MGLRRTEVSSSSTVDNRMSWSNMLALVLQNLALDFNSNCDCKFASSVMYLSCSNWPRLP